MTFQANVLLDTARELATAAKGKASVLKAEAEEAARVQRVWEDMSLYLHRGWPLHFLHLVDRAAPVLKRLRTENHPAIAGVEDAYRNAREQADTIIRRFPALLQDACKSASLPLDQDSRHPRYGFESHFFRLEIDEQKRLARLSDTEGRLAEFPADIGAVIETLQREHARVFKRPFDGRKFMKMLRSQYLSAAKKAKQPDGASVPIRQITQRLTKNLKGFRTDEFIVDLSRLTEQGPLQIDDRRLDLQQTKDTDQGMLLLGNAGRGYVGFIVFRKE